MSSTARTLKRLGVTTVGACTLLSTPYLGVAAAYAAPLDPTVTITSQVTGSASPRNDGTDTTVKVTANVVYSPASPAAANAPGGVTFTYQAAGGSEVLIGTDVTAPYSFQWTPPAGGGAGFSVYAEALTSNGASYGTPVKSAAATTSVTDASSVHVASPIEGSTLGYNVGSGNRIVVSGTRSADLPAIDLYTQVRDNATGKLTPSPINLAAPDGHINGVTSPAAGASQAWSTTATIAGTLDPALSQDVVITAVATNNGSSEEVTQAKLVKQTLTTFTVAPPSKSFPVNAVQPYVATAKDQTGAPIAGLAVTVGSSDPGFCTTDINAECAGTLFGPATASGTTDETGQATFDVQSSQPQTQTLTFQTNLNGSSYNASAGDLSTTATATTYTANAASATLTATPFKGLYAAQAEYTDNTEDPTTGAPVVTVCSTDQNGNPLPNANSGNLVVSVTRSYYNGTKVVTNAAVPAPFVASADTKKPNCFAIGHGAPLGSYGSDTFNAYYNNNGVAGYQAGTTDLQAQALTLNYGNLSITALNTQAQKGTATTVSFKVLGPDGSPFAGRKITLSNTKTATGGFTATQPGGTAAPTYTGNAGTVIATTDENGVARATVNDTAAESVAVTAKDDVLTSVAPTQVPTSFASDPATVDYREHSVALATLANGGYYIVRPDGSQNVGNVCNKGVAQPKVSFRGCYYGDNARPGDAVETGYQLLDVSGLPLANVTTTLTLDHGFFTPECTNENYEQCTFTTAQVAGAKVGDLKNAGKSLTITSDDEGYVWFTMGIGRDTEFDDDGYVPLTVTTVANGATKTNSTNFDGWYTDRTEPINGAGVKLVAATSADKLSGDVQGTAGQANNNSGTDFVVHLTDQFGNLVRTYNDDVTLTVTGNGTLSRTWDAGSFTSEPAVIHLDSSSTSKTGEAVTVTATWPAPVTTFTAPTTAGEPFTSTGTTANKTDSFTVNLYAIDFANLSYTFASTPSNSVPINTAVTSAVTVKDQKGNPVAGLNVKFIRSGPSDGAGNAQSGGATRTTGEAGKAGFSFSSGAPGMATATVIVTDGSGNELSRGVQNVTFTSSTPAPTGTVTIDGPASQFVKYGTRVVVTGKAPANSTVTVYFHRAYVAGLTPKAATANANGVWSVVYSAVDDFSYYAQVGSARAGTVLTRIDPSVSGADRTARKGQMVTVSGKSGARSAVNVHVGSAVHAVRADASGVWSYTFKFAGTVVIFANRTEHNVHTAGITIRG